MRSTKIIKICSSSLCTYLHHIHVVILRTRNKITHFFMILAWASPLNKEAPRTVINCLLRLIKLIGWLKNVYYVDTLSVIEIPSLSEMSCAVLPGGNVGMRGTR